MDKTELQQMTTPQLVNAYAASRVWFAVNKTTGPTRLGDAKHRVHCAIVTELRVRQVL